MYQSYLLVVILLLVSETARSFLFTKNPTLLSRSITNVRSTTEVNPSVSQEIERAVYITSKAMSQLQNLKEKKSDASYLRMGVKAGGCSGMSYVMDFITDADVNEDDYIEEYETIKCAIDPKSILYLYGMHLDYSDELIGGGFKFQNPNSETTCGCGKSFGV